MEERKLKPELEGEEEIQCETKQKTTERNKRKRNQSTIAQGKLVQVNIWRESIHDLDSLHEEHLQLIAKNKELENRISTLEEELLTLKQAIQRSERNNLSQDEDRRSVEGELEGDYMDMEGPIVDFVSKGNPSRSYPKKNDCYGFTEEIVTEHDFEESKKHEGSNIYTRPKGQPRKRVLSARVRSSWMTCYRKRKKQEVEGSFKTEQIECIQSME
ncbi:hypothetical protein SESBI_36708 [Sesbania bispinosa]|nr:hypothetical protein SESBI_36708 [Sesbania bispinosa]